MEPAFTTNPQKRDRSHTDYACCFVCQKGTEGGTLQKLTAKGYPAVLYAVENRQDDVSYRLRNDVTVEREFLEKNPVFHLRCRSTYTHRKNIATKRKDEDTDITGSSSAYTPHTRSASSCVNYKTECFICEKARSRKGDRHLLLVSNVNRQSSIWECAQKLNDSQMLHKLQGFGNKCIDMVAGDFRYHRQCMSSYLMSTNSDLSFTQSASNAYDSAMAQLASEIDDSLFKDGGVFFITTLLHTFHKHLTDCGIKTAIAYRAQSLKLRLQNYYTCDSGCRIMIVPQKGTSSLVCSSDISVGRLMAQVRELKQTLTEEEYTEESDGEMQTEDTLPIRIMSYHTAKSIRIEIKEQRQREKKVPKSYKDAGSGTVIQ